LTTTRLGVEKRRTDNRLHYMSILSVECAFCQFNILKNTKRLIVVQSDRGAFSIASGAAEAHHSAMKTRFCSALFMTLLSFATARGAEITATAPGSPLRKTILDDLRAAEPTASMQKEKKQKIVFDNVTLRVAGDWVWFAVAPRTVDSQWHSEPLSGLLHFSTGHWRVVAYVNDKASAAGKPEKGYEAWRAELLKKNPERPPDLVPKQE